MVGHPVRDHRVSAADPALRRKRREVQQIERAPLAQHHADEHTRVGAGECARVDGGVFQSTPDGLEDQALLRVERGRFNRGDPEELVIEQVGVVDEVGVPGVHGARPQLWAVEAVDVPPGGGHHALGDRSVHQEPPQLVDVRGAGESAIHADDSDGNHGTLLVCAARWPAMSSMVG